MCPHAESLPSLALPPFGLLVSSLGRSYGTSQTRILECTTPQRAPEDEWLYAFDIHANACFHVCTPLDSVSASSFAMSASFLATLFSNTLYAGAFAYYFYVSFLGYVYLPFLNKEQVTYLLYPVGAIAVIYVSLLSSAFTWVRCCSVFSFKKKL